MRRITVSLLALLALASAAPAQAAPFTTTLNPAVSPADQDILYFAQTGHHLRREFKRFWQAHGGLDILGLPLTEAFQEDGLTVQYLERARLELHPENPDAFRVQLTRLGAHFTEGRADPAFTWLGGAPEGSDRGFFAESGHTIGGAFRGFWEGRGGLAAFGFPISEELAEVSATNGMTYTVQYYERARFEYHPENSGTPYEVQLSQIGRQFLNERPAAQAQTAPVPGLQLLGRAVTGFPGSVPERRQNIVRATMMLDGAVIAPGATHSFAAMGDFSPENGFVEGYGIVGGRLEKVLGGGLCQVSTTLFRAVSNAGMPIVERLGHDHVVYFYENVLGFDATVFTPEVDFKWRNDSGAPITISALVDLAQEQVTFELYGLSDGRSVSYTGPEVRNETRPGTAVWQLDPEMRPGTVSQLVHGRSGWDVSIGRTIRWPDGRSQTNTYNTHYTPWEDFYAYGAGVKPPAGVRVLPPKPAKRAG